MTASAAKAGAATRRKTERAGKGGWNATHLYELGHVLEVGHPRAS